MARGVIGIEVQVGGGGGAGLGLSENELFERMVPLPPHVAYEARY